MKKTFDIETPKTILIGDPEYFKKYKGRKLTSMIVNRKTTKKDCAKVKIEEIVDTQFKNKSIEMTLYIAPKEHIDTYMKDQCYKIQTIKQKQIETNSSKCLFEIDDKKNLLNASNEPWFGTEYTYRHKQNDKNILDAIVINVSLPEEITFDEAEDYVKELFKK